MRTGILWLLLLYNINVLHVLQFSNFYTFHGRTANFLVEIFQESGCFVSVLNHG